MLPTMLCRLVHLVQLIQAGHATQGHLLKEGRRISYTPMGFQNKSQEKIGAYLMRLGVERVRSSSAVFASFGMLDCSSQGLPEA